MDEREQLYDGEATGWRRGLYDDIKHTLRTPFVNWIFRTLVANEPEFTRYMWGQVKPLFETQAFAHCSIEYRDTVLAGFESAGSLPAYRRDELGVAPSEFRELRAQLATFDVVAPRLAVLFEVLDRLFDGEPVGHDPPDARSITAPFPEWLDSDRGSRPTMIGFDEVPDGLDRTVAEIRDFHRFGEGLPSIYRCLAQWPAFLAPAWNDLRPTLDSDAYDDVVEDAHAVVEGHVDTVAYRPRLTPEDLREAGFDGEVIGDLTDLFGEFKGGHAGAATRVHPLLHAFAATVDATGQREL